MRIAAIRTAIARHQRFSQNTISGMSVVQLFTRNARPREFEKRNRDNMFAWRDAILAYALFYPAVEFLSFATIALIFWSGGNVFSLHAQPWRSHGLHDVRAAFFRRFRLLAKNSTSSNPRWRHPSASSSAG